MALDAVPVPALLALAVAAVCAAVGAGIGTGHLEGPDSSACTCPSTGGLQISLDAYVAIPFDDEQSLQGVSATLPVPSSAVVLLRCDLSDATTQVLTIAWNAWDENTSTTHAPPPTPPAPVTQSTASITPPAPSTVTQPTSSTTPSMPTQPTSSTTASVPSSPADYPDETTTPTTTVTQSEPSTMTTGQDTTTMVTESVPTTTTTGEETTTMVTESVPSTTTTGEDTTTMVTESVPSTTRTGEETTTMVTESAPSTTRTGEETTTMVTESALSTTRIGEETTTMTTESATSNETSFETTIQSYPVQARIAEKKQTKILTKDRTAGTAEETNSSAEVTTETVRTKHIRAKSWYRDTDTDNQLTLWIKSDNSTFYLAKVTTKFRFKVVPNEFYLVTHSSDVNDWVTPLGHTLKCNLETRLGDSITGMFCIEELQLAAFISGNCIFPEDVVSCPWIPDETEDNPSTLSGVLIAGIALGTISLAGIFWLGARRLYLSFITVRAKQQDIVL